MTDLAILLPLDAEGEYHEELGCLSEFGLSVDYVEPDTFEEQKQVTSGINCRGEGHQTNSVITSIMTVAPIISNTGLWTGSMGQRLNCQVITKRS